MCTHSDIPCSDNELRMSEGIHGQTLTELEKELEHLWIAKGEEERTAAAPRKKTIQSPVSLLNPSLVRPLPCSSSLRRCLSLSLSLSPSLSLSLHMLYFNSGSPCWVWGIRANFRREKNYRRVWRPVPPKSYISMSPIAPAFCQCLLSIPLRQKVGFKKVERIL